MKFNVYSDFIYSFGCVCKCVHWTIWGHRTEYTTWNMKVKSLSRCDRWDAIVLPAITTSTTCSVTISPAENKGANAEVTEVHHLPSCLFLPPTIQQDDVPLTTTCVSDAWLSTAGRMQHCVTLAVAAAAVNVDSWQLLGVQLVLSFLPNTVGLTMHGHYDESSICRRAGAK